jgi:nitrogen fixation/metabolism regulation signal transduction histidine kinase
VRPSRLEIQIALALALAAAVPLLAALWLASRLAEENLAFGLNPRVIASLEATPGLYRELFNARKELYGEQVRQLALGLPSELAQVEPYLREALERTPRLRGCTFAGADGAVLAEAETDQPNPEGEWRAAPARATLIPSGAALVCTFAIEARFFADLDEVRELAESYQGAGLLRADIQRSYVGAFAVLLMGFAVAAAGTGFWLARRTTRRLGAVIRGVRELASGDLSVQVDPGGARDEVAGLARAFNAMVREVRESRDRIVYLEKISGWQEVARRLAHEIKNPLTPIQLAFQQLEARFRQAGPGDPELPRLLSETGEIVREEIATLQRLVEEFSGFAKLPDVRLEPAELGEFVEEFLRTSPQVAETADVELAKATEPCPVRIDRALLRRALANLARNAEEAARPARARLHLAVAREGGRAVLAVADEGPGVPAELRERIFDPYFTTRVHGTGLGLAIVKKIVLQHGGEIDLSERPGGGARFAIRLPLSERAADAGG